MYKMDLSAYRQIAGPINKSCIIKHHFVPSHNFVSSDILQFLCGINNEGLNKTTNSPFPENLPVYIPFEYDTTLWHPFNVGNGLVDVTPRILQQKKNWEEKSKNLQNFNLEKALVSIKNFRRGKGKLSKNVIKYIKHFEEDPLPGFYGNYNWLYSGGNLSVSDVNESKVLISADYPSNSTEFSIKRLTANLLDIDKELSYSLKKNSPILQIASKTKQDSVYILVRQKRNLNFLKVNDCSSFDSVIKLWSKRTSNMSFLTSADLSHNCKFLVLADSKSYVHVYDTETRKKIGGGKKICSKEKYEPIDNWNQVLCQNNLIYVANRNYLCALDSKNISLKPIMKYSPSLVTYECEDISSMTCSKTNSNTYYLGTNHHLLQIDIRNQKAIQKWTHMMKNTPQFLNCVETDNSDLIILQSLNPDEIVGILNNYVSFEGEVNFFSKSLPRALKCPRESLKYANMNECCLSPCISRRYDFSITGTQCLKSIDGDIRLFSLNGGGDIFQSKIYKNQSDIKQNDDLQCKKLLERMKAFETLCLKVWSAKWNKKHLSTVDMGVILNELENDEVNFEEPEKIYIWKNSEMFDENSLIMFKDVIAEEVQDLWLWEEDEERDPVIASDALQRVHEWVENIDRNNESSMD